MKVNDIKIAEDNITKFVLQNRLFVRVTWSTSRKHFCRRVDLIETV